MKSYVRTIFLLLFVCSTATLFVLANWSKPTSASSPQQLFLPLITAPSQPFNPTTDVQLPGGSYTYSEINIPATITVTVLGDVTFHVAGNITIAGKVVGDCHSIELQGQADVSITGTLDNRCPAETETPADLTIHTNGGTLAVGTPDTPATTHTSGNLDISNAPHIQPWEFDVLPDQRSDSLLPPVCSSRADTLEDTVVAGFPIEVGFYAEAADPDGGPLTYAWAFGDGNTSTERDPVHAYATWGIFIATLTVTDDDAQTCQATLQLVMDDGMNNIPDSPAAWAEPVDLVVEAGQAALFVSAALDAQGDAISYTWAFGDGSNSAESAPSHTYAAAGRYEVSLTATDTAGNTAVSTSSIYVYQTTQLRLPASPQGGSCLVPGPNVFNTVYDGGTAATGGNGASVRVIYGGGGTLYLGAGTDLKAQDGGNGRNRTGVGTVTGGKGGRGGSIEVFAEGYLIVCGGASIAAGNGGNGGSATATSIAPSMAWARGGHGGDAARRLSIAATDGLEFQSPLGTPVTINPGNGGDGGLASATGGDGDAACPLGEPGGSAKANGGNGGQASKRVIVRGIVVGLASITVEGGQGGDGGPGTAVGGDGGNATCVTIAAGGAGAYAEARGGAGGEAKLGGAGGFFLAADAFTAGTGGNGTAFGGWGGNATATPPGGTVATGGVAAYAFAVGGKGGAGQIDGDGGNADATGGWGGDAIATGEPGAPCAAGGAATATGGLGGDGLALSGLAGGGTGTDGSSTATGRDGGDATAAGGRGGDCPTCPAGKGGDGGPATATGGDGGLALGDGTMNDGNGGDANATGGRGGDGADCCDMTPKLPGGNGGKGGDTTSIAGNPGGPGGVDGTNGIQGGRGGDGGDGKPQGFGGPGGLGIGTPVDIPDGLTGIDGLFCGDIWYIYHCIIPDGPIIPGTNYPLPTYADDQQTQTGVVQAHFLTPEEFDGGTVGYIKQSPMVIVQRGGIRYDLQPVVGEFPVISVEATVNHSCQSADCVFLIGYYQGEEVMRVGNQGTMMQETLVLPPPPPTVPVYDSFALVGYENFSFDCWWIVIVDP